MAVRNRLSITDIAILNEGANNEIFHPLCTFLSTATKTDLVVFASLPYKELANVTVVNLCTFSEAAIFWFEYEGAKKSTNVATIATGVYENAVFVPPQSYIQVALSPKIKQIGVIGAAGGAVTFNGSTNHQLTP